MIYETLSLLAEQINIYIDQVKKQDDGVTSPVVVLENISCSDKKEFKTNNKIILSLFNINEELALKNAPPNLTVKNDPEKHGNLPMGFNLCILITTVMSDYENALKYLSHIITFFNNKSRFTSKDCITKVNGLTNNLNIIVECYSLNLEQSYSLWGSLRMGQLPYICYKVRVVHL
jgi:hypothetical protein